MTGPQLYNGNAKGYHCYTMVRGKSIIALQWSGKRHHCFTIARGKVPQLYNCQRKRTSVLQWSEKNDQLYYGQRKMVYLLYNGQRKRISALQWSEEKDISFTMVIGKGIDIQWSEEKCIALQWPEEKGLIALQWSEKRTSTLQWSEENGIIALQWWERASLLYNGEKGASLLYNGQKGASLLYNGQKGTSLLYNGEMKWVLLYNGQSKGPHCLEEQVIIVLKWLEERRMIALQNYNYLIQGKGFHCFKNRPMAWELCWSGLCNLSNTTWNYLGVIEIGFLCTIICWSRTRLQCMLRLSCLQAIDLDLDFKVMVRKAHKMFSQRTYECKIKLIKSLPRSSIQATDLDLDFNFKVASMSPSYSWYFVLMNMYMQHESNQISYCAYKIAGNIKVP